jgi:hypothetical protein
LENFGVEMLENFNSKKKWLKECLTENFTPMKFKEQLAQKCRDRLDEERGKIHTTIHCTYRTWAIPQQADKAYEIFLLFHMDDTY